ncbi:MAG: hypothetical protein Q8O67_14880 [Deltaproteobacteria bacterium]|nr:hypothetical protein [Deltaproteobacteria bacterium]
MKRLFTLVLVVVGLLAGCPDTDTVGHAPKKQLDDVRARTKAAEIKDAQHAKDVAAIPQE